jgi:hypothetical protein
MQPKGHAERPCIVIGNADLFYVGAAAGRVRRIGSRAGADRGARGRRGGEQQRKGGQRRKEAHGRRS